MLDKYQEQGIISMTDQFIIFGILLFVLPVYLVLLVLSLPFILIAKIYKLDLKNRGTSRRKIL